MPKRITRPPPLVGGIGLVSSLIDMSPSSVRRLEAIDPQFPRAFKLNERGDRQWVVAEILAWLEAKAGRPLAA